MVSSEIFAPAYLQRKLNKSDPSPRLTSISDYVAHLDGYTVIPGGWVNHNYRQFGIQLADSIAGGAYSFTMTVIILLCINGLALVLPILRLRADDLDEVMGIDEAEIGEFAVSKSNRTDSSTFADGYSMIMSRVTEMWNL